jgi:hypothetical protein
MKKERERERESESLECGTLEVINDKVQGQSIGMNWEEEERKTGKRK